MNYFHPHSYPLCITLHIHVQLWRVDEAESMLRSALKYRPRYMSAMTSLGVILQINGKVRIPPD